MIVSIIVTAIVVGSSAYALAPGKVVPKKPEYTFYWISHGSEGDPIWMYALSGARKAEEALPVEVKASLHAGDVASQKEAMSTAIAAGADGIAISSPEKDVLDDLVADAKEKGIPVVIFNTDDPGTGRDAYVGPDAVKVGEIWANYLVDKDLVEEGDFVWMPVEVPGASYQELETKGIKSVFDPLGIEYMVFDASLDPAKGIARMSSYLLAHGKEVDAIIGLGDLVTGNLSKVFEKVGWEPGHVPVVGWGNSLSTVKEVRDGYVNAAAWHFPYTQGFIPIVELYNAATGHAIRYDVYSLSLFDKNDIDEYIEYARKLE